ncbi:MAG: hypothetical protein VX603_06460, partial [Gemmatimonadota bacterium]|nr:hypothetical protein [Gemmatimonadota bacterium]
QKFYLPVIEGSRSKFREAKVRLREVQQAMSIAYDITGVNIITEAEKLFHDAFGRPGHFNGMHGD